MRIPSVKKLALVFGDKAKEARKILEMSRSELIELPAGAARVAECYHPPKTYDIRLHCLDALGETYGIEAQENNEGEFMDWLNVGDTYAPTIIRWRGNYLVSSWGDVVENPRNKFGE